MSTVKRKTLVINYLKEHTNTIVSHLLELSKISKNAWYSKKKEPDTTRKECILSLIKEVKESEFHYYGYNRITTAIKAVHAIALGHNYVYKIMKENGLLQKKKKSFKPKMTNSKHDLPTYVNLMKSLPIIFPYQVWASDTTYIRVGKKFVYLAFVYDCGLHKIVGYALSNRNDTDLVMEALNMALANTKILPEFHHSDRGSTYCSNKHSKLLTEKGIKISNADVGMSVDNPYAESLNARIKEECIQFHDFQNIHEAREVIEKYIEQYNNRRIHSSLGMSPSSYEKTLSLSEQGKWLKVRETVLENP